MEKTSGQDTQVQSGCVSTDDRPRVRLRHCMARVKVPCLCGLNSSHIALEMM
jgi:hypothetical protein